LNEEVRRRFYRKWKKSKQKAFSKYSQKAKDNKDLIDGKLNKFMK
jgi:hypothetical protein